MDHEVCEKRQTPCADPAALSPVHLGSPGLGQGKPRCVSFPGRTEPLSQSPPFASLFFRASEPVLWRLRQELRVSHACLPRYPSLLLLLLVKACPRPPLSIFIAGAKTPAPHFASHAHPFAVAKCVAFTGRGAPPYIRF